ncbi:hypothetical protein ACT6QH_02650 [Xanthobacter sp. TB0139]|uniref:hypothetical protein n=1 Tax=Xanthobacter sp. TB0139 TaxID=3459178 RepID=UPI004039BB19
MKKIVIGIGVVVVLAIAGGTGLDLWLKQRVHSEVEQSFSTLRASGVEAEFAATGFNTLDRRVTIDNVRIASHNGNSVLTVKNLTMHIAAPPQDGRLKADDAVLTGITLTLKDEAAGGGQMVYSIPDMTLRGYEGPLSLLASDQHEGPYAALRLVLRQLATLKADEVKIPLVTALFAPAPKAAEPVRVESVLHNLTLENLVDGKAKRLTLARSRITSANLPGPQDSNQETGAPSISELKEMVIHDIDTAPILAATAMTPDAGEKPYGQLFRLLETGPHTLTEEDSTASISALQIEKFGIHPSAFAADKVEAFNKLKLKGSSLSLEEGRQMLALSIGLIEAVSFSRLTLSDLDNRDSLSSDQIGVLELKGLSSGVLASLELRQSRNTDQSDIIELDRLALSQLDISALVRANELADDAPAEAGLLMFRIFSGFELNKLKIQDAPEQPQAENADNTPAVQDEDTPQTAATTPDEPLQLEKLSVSWGDLLEGAPTRVNLQLSGLSLPLDDEEEDIPPFNLMANAGYTHAIVGTSLNLAYDQTSETLTLAPLEAAVKDALTARIEVRMGNVPKTVFTEDDALEESMATFTAGPATLTLTNQGIVEMMLKQKAKEAGVSEEEYREIVVGIIQEVSQPYAGVPDVGNVVQALISFVQNPGTLTLSITPKGKPLLLTLLGTDDLEALAQSFKIQARAEPRAEARPAAAKPAGQP